MYVFTRFQTETAEPLAWIMNYQLMAADFLPVSIAKENRLEYYEALDTYAVHHDLQPFIEIIAALEEQRLDEYLSIIC